MGRIPRLVRAPDFSFHGHIPIGTRADPLRHYSRYQSLRGGLWLRRRDTKPFPTENIPCRLWYMSAISCWFSGRRYPLSHSRCWFPSSIELKLKFPRYHTYFFFSQALQWFRKSDDLFRLWFSSIEYSTLDFILIDSISYELQILR